MPEGAEDEEDSDDQDDGASDDDIVPFETTISSLTADYAMQNVILQMNMKLLTPDGMRITNLRRWVLRCHACQEVTRNTERVFCPKCGNASLNKVEHTVTADGVEQFGVRRKHILKGTRFALPMPKGGRKEKAPILREDQEKSKRTQVRAHQPQAEVAKTLLFRTISFDAHVLVQVVQSNLTKR